MFWGVRRVVWERLECIRSVCGLRGVFGLFIEFKWRPFVPEGARPAIAGPGDYEAYPGCAEKSLLHAVQGVIRQKVVFSDRPQVGRSRGTPDSCGRGDGDPQVEM